MFDSDWFDNFRHLVTDCFFHDPDTDNLRLQRQYFKFMLDFRKLEKEYTDMLYELSDLDNDLPFKKF